MELNHFSSIGNFLRIVSSGYIDRTFSRLRLQQLPEEHPVVFLTSNSSSSHDVQAWQEGSLVLNGRWDFDVAKLDSYNLKRLACGDKTRIRFVLDLEISERDPTFEQEPACYRWDHWSMCLRRQEELADALKTTGGDWESWCISEHRIFSQDWLRIEDAETLAVLWTDGDFTEEAERLVNHWAPIAIQIGSDRAFEKEMAVGSER